MGGWFLLLEAHGHLWAGNALVRDTAPPRPFLLCFAFTPANVNAEEYS